jgi:hypothetical protein
VGDLWGIGFFRFPIFFLKLVRKSTKFYATIIVPDGVSDLERMQHLVVVFSFPLLQELCRWRSSCCIFAAKK